MVPTFVKLTRKELYDLVWSVPLLTLSKKYNISDSGLRKVCIRMSIPLPNSGHWMKIQHNKRIQVKPLPTNHKGEQETTLEVRTEYSRNPSKLKALTEELTSAEALNLRVPETLTNADKLILAAESNLRKKKKSDRPDETIKLEPLDTWVSVKHADRALRIMDTFIKVLRNRGHDIKFEGYEMFVVVGEEKIQISLKQRSTRVLLTSVPYPYHDYQLTDEFIFKIDANYYRREWKDDKEKLENKLAAIIAKIELEGERMREETIERKKAALEREERERIAKELRLRREKQLSDFSDLFYKADQWKRVTVIREYIDHVETNAQANEMLTEELKDWLCWARKKADWFDPTLDVRDELLGEEDKKKLLQSFKPSSNSNNGNTYGYFEMNRNDDNWRKPWYSRK